jgi:hypothetical protein
MNPLVKEIWLKALRSGEYQQCRAYLHTESGYCCLGVLSELACQSGEVDLERKWWSEARFETFGSGSSFLDSRVATWAGLNADREQRLASMNDAGKSFLEIADYIEEHL